MRLKSVKPKVRAILAEQVEARGNDGHLIAHYIAKYHSSLVTEVEIPIEGSTTLKKAILLSNFRYLPSFETIRRCRQIIQNDDNEFLPDDPKVRIARRIKEENYRNAEVREAKGITHPYPND